MSQTELLRTQLDTVRLEMQQLQVENERIRESQPGKAALVDAQKETEKFRVQSEHLTKEVEDLRIQLHEAQNNEAKAAEEADAVKKELQDQQEGRRADAEEITQLYENCKRIEEKCDKQTEQLQNDRGMIAQLDYQCRNAETRCGQLEAERERSELEHYRKLETERLKWEEREQRLVQQLEEAHRRIRAAEDARKEDSNPRTTDVEMTSPPMIREPHRVSFGADLTATVSSGMPATSLSHVVQHRQDGVSSPNPSLPVSDPLWSAALFAHQLPPIRQFTGEDVADSGETFQDWIEQLEMIASISGWDERTKLVNLTTRLRGQAYAFYKSCPEQRRRNYAALVAELTKRFTPVRLRAVQSGLFHDRKQQHPKETVDAYAQDLRRLFYLAYPQAQQGTEEAEDMGRSVLSYQFVACLGQDIKIKLAGVEGTFEELLVKARLEEAKLRDFADRMSGPPSRKSTPIPAAHTRDAGGEKGGHSNIERSARGGPKCYYCRGHGHIAKNCPVKGRAAPTESRGRGAGNGTGSPRTTIMNHLVADGNCTTNDRVEELRRALREAELEASISSLTTTIHGVERVRVARTIWTD